LGFFCATEAREEASFDQYLKTVADSQDWSSGSGKFSEGIAETIEELDGQDLAGGNVVSVGEATREDSQVVFEDLGRGFDEGKNMNPFCRGAGEFQGRDGFAVAIRTSSDQDECVRDAADHVSRISSRPFQAC
jgi:hypothetical protein